MSRQACKESSRAHIIADRELRSADGACHVLLPDHTHRLQCTSTIPISIIIIIIITSTITITISIIIVIIIIMC